jgi:hypothetical protein
MLNVCLAAKLRSCDRKSFTSSFLQLFFINLSDISYLSRLQNAGCHLHARPRRVMKTRRFYTYITLFVHNSFNDAMTTTERSRDSAIGIGTGYGLDDREVEVQVPVGSRIFSSPRCPDRLWGPPSLLFNG